MIFAGCGVFTSFSQNYLTNGQVYNFNVGDVFETQSGSSEGGPPTYGLTIILGKWYSSLSDTVFYKDSVVYYTPPACPPPCVGSFSSHVSTVYYTHLSSRASQDTGNSPCPLSDTIYYDSTYPYCDRKVWEESPSQVCIDSTQESMNTYSTQSWLVEGCGGPYYIMYAFDFINDTPYSDYYSLIYSKKHDTICGNEVVIAGVDPVKQVAPLIEVYPNPSKGLFTIALVGAQNFVPEVEIYNVLGEKVTIDMLNQVQRNYELDFSNQPAGVYFYRIVSNSGQLIGEGKLIIQK